MKLVSVTIKNFRSITSAYKIPLSDFSVLVGPNNQGKSNVLAAIVLALGLLEGGIYSYKRQRLSYRYSDSLEAYSWPRDYPIGLQTSQPGGKSEVTLEFRMSPLESAAFKKRTKVNLSTDLKLKLHFGEDDARVELLLQGKAKKSLTDESTRAIARFVADKVFLQYIPAVRPAELAEEVINRILSTRLSALEVNEEYKLHISAIEKLQQPILDDLSRELKITVQSFIPDISGIYLKTSGAVARAISRSAQITVDDGANTSLRMKGDGIKSLVAISLMKHASQSALGGKSLILAIEEPESHLHPNAVHRLREVLQEVSKESQVILTTHAVPLVDRERPTGNIIVKDGYATSATSLADVRDALGVHQSDNLSSARLVLVVEGYEDEQVLRAWLPGLSTEIGAAIVAGELAFDPMGGAGNLEYKVRLHKANICAVHALLDHDEAGRNAIDKATASGILGVAEYHLTLLSGYQNTELEDCIKPEVYLSQLSAKLGITITENDVSKNEKKYVWSDRIKIIVEANAKMWSKALEAEIKKIVATCAVETGILSLEVKKKQPIEALAEALKARILGVVF
jgi:putative ATP-dependent endonuclease of the OLD family